MGNGLALLMLLINGGKRWNNENKLLLFLVNSNLVLAAYIPSIPQDLALFLLGILIHRLRIHGFFTFFAIDETPKHHGM